MRKQLKAKQRLREVIRYVIHWFHEKDAPLSYPKLELICYMADMEHYRKHGKPLTGSIYRAQAEGPRPEGFRDIIIGMLKRGEITVKDEP